MEPFIPTNKIKSKAEKKPLTEGNNKLNKNENT